MKINEWHTQIHDTAKIDHYTQLIEALVDKPSHISLAWLKDHQWAAVPVPDSLNEMDAEWIAEAAHNLGYAKGVAISTELKGMTRVYLINFTQEELLLFDLNFSLQNFIIIPEDGKFAVLKEAGFYFIIAGPRDFVRQAIGCSFATARTMFLRYTDDDDTMGQRERTLYINVAKRYEAFDGN